MSAILLNLSMVVGMTLGILSLLVGLGRGVSIWPALCRSAIVVSVGTLVVMAFFRAFNTVLYRFLAQKLRERNAHEAVQAPEEGDKE
jgi:hypothetical protein